MRRREQRAAFTLAMMAILAVIAILMYATGYR